MAKDGKSNNLAAALTFFLATNAVAYHDLEMPSDDTTDKIFEPLQEAMNSTPEIVQMTNAQKEQMHDWLVCMAGFVLAGYIEAKQTRDKKSLENFRQIAALSSQIVGVDISRVTITKAGLKTIGALRTDTIFVPELRSGHLAE